MRAALLLIVVTSGCAAVAPKPPRFVVLYDQREQTCRIQVVRDTRSSACWVAFLCGRHAPVVVAVGADVCVP